MVLVDSVSVFRRSGKESLDSLTSLFLPALPVLIEFTQSIGTNGSGYWLCPELNPLIYLGSHAGSWTWIEMVSYTEITTREGNRTAQPCFKRMLTDSLLYLHSDMASITYRSTGHAVWVTCQWGGTEATVTVISMYDIKTRVRVHWMNGTVICQEQYSHSSYSGHNDVLFIGSWKSELSNCQKKASLC